MYFFLKIDLKALGWTTVEDNMYLLILNLARYKQLCHW